MKPRTLIIAAGIVLGLLIVWGIVHSMSARVPVEAAKAEIGSIREFVDERGMTRLPKTYLITMPIAGRIEAIRFEEDEHVPKGKVVAQIVPRDLQLAVDEANAAVGRLNARISENAYKKVEETALDQAKEFVKSMTQTVKAAGARVMAGEARLDYAKQNLERVNELAKTHALSKDELQQSVARQKQAYWDKKQDDFVFAATEAMEAATNLMPALIERYMDRKPYAELVLQQQKAEAEARLQDALQNQQRGTMHSPVDGVVLRRAISNERYLAAGDTLLEIGRLEDLEVEADILSLDVVDAKIGDHVEIYGPAIGKEPAKGKVHRIYPAGFTKVSSLGVEQQRVKIIIHFDPHDLTRLREQQDLGVGYRVRVRITTAQKSDAMVIPRSALFRGPQGQWQVYVIRRGKAMIEDVKIGLMNDEKAEITSQNIEAGDRVVLAPESKLTEGSRVSAKKQKEPETAQP